MKANNGSQRRSCQYCSRRKSSQLATTVQPTPVPQKHSNHVRVNLVDTLPASASSNSYLFMVYDHSSCCLEMVSLKTMDAVPCRDVLVYIYLDLQVWSAAVDVLCRCLRIRHTTTILKPCQVHGGKSPEPAQRLAESSIGRRQVAVAPPVRRYWAPLSSTYRQQQPSLLLC